MLYNTDIEKVVLGCLILDNTLILQARKDIVQQAFFNTSYSKLYNEILKVHESKSVADIATLKSLDVEELVDICNSVPTVSNFNVYRKELLEMKAKRDLVSMIDKIKISVTQGETSVEELKTEALGFISDIELPEQEKEDNSILASCSEALERLESIQNNTQSHFKWGIKWLDEQTGGVKPTLTYLAARPSMGKTAFALQIARSIAVQGGKVAIFSLEMDKVTLTNRLICNAGGINKNCFDKRLPIKEEDWVKISKTAANVSNLSIHIYDKYFRIEEILLKAEEQRAKEGLDLLVLDYIQLTESSQNHKSTNDRISYISRQLKKYQQKTGVNVFVLSQFNRGADSNEYPLLSHLRDSGSLEQDGRNIWFLHCEKEDPSHESKGHKEVKLIIAKQSEGERNIYKNLKFYGVTQRFFEN